MEKLLIIIIVLSVVFFLYNRIKAWRQSEPLLKRIYQSKSTLSLGIFLAAFGANLLISPRNTIDWVVGIVFLIFGIANLIYGFRARSHYINQLP
ncbi:YtpI family protein [Halalkalibacter sp. APA_J-10(15)]|uniref:YtpI family protein n=1 Tax=Halalkalibacter sp. APA_J-10(15) TaxID=2933805 RepID=UPI001FF1322D|nr:YtpI family protein [Halalkalibacter sp. APA_J-10(15)]MCK0471332.1 YtpI family protein [Halalkalibacter sp. APA_J-10(15)]